MEVLGDYKKKMTLGKKERNRSNGKREIVGSNCFYFVIWLNSSLNTSMWMYVGYFAFMPHIYVNGSVCLNRMPYNHFWKKNKTFNERKFYFLWKCSGISQKYSQSFFFGSLIEGKENESCCCGKK